MNIKLSPQQCRVIGVMLEKEVTTPDQYPLSLNGLTNGCNQKSSRDPVMSLTEEDVQNVIDELTELKLISEQSGVSRVAKYKHRFCNTEFGHLRFSQQQLAIICILLLRGPQTPGELRTRTNRMADFANVSEVEAVLSELTDHNGTALVIKLAREPGKRDSRYGHLLSDIDYSDIVSGAVNEHHDTMSSASPDRIKVLEDKIEVLTTQLEELHKLVDELLK